VVLGKARVVQDLLQLVIQPIRFLVVGRAVCEVNGTIGVEGHAIVGHRKVLRREPEVDGVPGGLGQ
jgi:hypothetical protein